MQYREFGHTGCRVSALGFGCMRFPVLDENNGASIDEKRAVAMLRNAIDSGVNYVDTAYFYHDSFSEVIVGKALADGYRNKVYLATKLPMGEVKQTSDFDRLLNDQLKKLNTDHIDFYLFHALNREHWQNAKKLGLINKMQQAKADGRIKHCGFSFHDDLSVFKTIVDEYTGCEFCQIQLNYLDTDYQAGQEGLEYASDKGLGVVIMEPLRGGYLALPPKKIAECIPKNKTPVEAALDFVWNYSSVSVVLSGMSTEQQVECNLALANKSAPAKLTLSELNAYKNAAVEYNKMQLIPCTDCRYCQPCPHGVTIPDIFAAYNLIKNGDRRTVKENMPDIEDRISLCKKCGECEKKCPQNIKIIDELKHIADCF